MVAGQNMNFLQVQYTVWLRIFHSNGVPVESTIALTEETFTLGTELMPMSIIHGGPAPNFMSPVIYHIMDGFQITLLCDDDLCLCVGENHFTVYWSLQVTYC